MAVDISSSSSLFSSSLNSTIQPNPNFSPPHPRSQPLRGILDDVVIVIDDGDDDVIIFDKTALNRDLFPPLSPLHSSTPRPGPLTQEVVDRMLELRRVDDVVAADEARPPFLVMQREIEDLKSELAAARLQLEENDIEMCELRQQLKARPQQKYLPHPPPPQEFADGYQTSISKKKKKKMKKKRSSSTSRRTNAATRLHFN